jgi:hypothetical protein
MPKSKAGRASKLAYLIQDQPGLYAKMLGYVRAGAYFHVAAAAIGVAPETVSRWLSKGQKAKSGPYAQFRQDVTAAVAEAAVVTEAQVREAKPELWLKCGPRRLLGDEWREDQLPTTVVNVEASGRDEPSLPDLAAALLELHKAGVITFHTKENGEPFAYSSPHCHGSPPGEVSEPPICMPGAL